jgi:hypothetical protein
MKIDFRMISARLAADEELTDYDFWRAIKMIENELYRIERERLPIPMQILHARHILKTARAQRLAEGY